MTGLYSLLYQSKMRIQHSTEGKKSLVSVIVLVNDQEISGTDTILSVLVENSVNRIPYAEVQIMDGDPATGDFPISNLSTYIPGNTLVIKAGYEGKNEIIFSGIIISHGIKISKDKGSFLIIEGRDKAIGMTLGRKNATYEKKSDSDIFSEILEKYKISEKKQSAGLSDPPTSDPPQIVQYYVTDWDFILTRADLNGQIVVLDGGEMSLYKPDTSAEPVLEVQYGDSLISFDASIDASSQLSAVKCSSWDMKTQVVLSADGKNPELTLPGNLTSTVLAGVVSPADYTLQSSIPLTKSDLQNWADASMVKSHLAKFTGTATVKGNASLIPGSLLGLAGLGDRFNGKAFISSIRHTLKDGEWITEARLGLRNERFTEIQNNIIDASAASQLPGIRGLHIGKVIQIQDDPDNEFRVLVKTSFLPDESTGIWARLAQPYATNAAGLFFYPEVGDEVILNFINEDPRFPVIIGSVYSSANPPPFIPDEKNTIKAIVTNKQLKITFDEENMVTSILTPKSNSIVLSEKDESITITDQNKNVITLSSSGIEIKSCKDVIISAPGDITLKADGNILSTATMNMTSKAVQFKVSATAEFKVDAAVAEVAASGTMTIKGAMVMIN